MNFGSARAAALAVALSPLLGCQQQGSLVQALDSAVVGTAHAETPSTTPPPNGLWREGGQNLGDFRAPVSLAPLVKAIKPGVVNINTTSIAKRQQMQVPPGFEDFFHQFHGGRGGDAEPERRQSLGSGFIINPAGYVITNNHVIDGASEIKVTLDDGREFTAKVVGRDPKTDVALLKLQPNGQEVKDLPTVPLGDSEALQVGDYVLAAGNPFGLDHSVSQGIVSAKERVIGAGPYDEFIQTDAAINPGNSGGPLFNMKGEVVGVNTAIVAQGQGIGFAVPINMAKELLPQLLNSGKVVRGWLGVSIQEVTPDIAKSLGLGKAGGALVGEVMKRGPAAASGLEAGDVVTAVNGRKVETYNQLSRFVAGLAPGAKAQLTVMRGGKERAIPVKVGERPEDERTAWQQGGDEESAQPSAVDKLGISVAALGTQRARQVGVEEGVQISAVEPDSAAARAGARPGDVIVEMQRQPVRNVRDYAQIAHTLKVGDTALIRVRREGAAIFIAVPLR